MDLARAATGLDDVPVARRPRLLSDNGPCYISGQLATYLETHGLPHTRSAPYHPMTQGKSFAFYQPVKMADAPLWIDVSELMAHGIGDYISQFVAIPEHAPQVGKYAGCLDQWKQYLPKSETE